MPSVNFHASGQDFNPASLEGTNLTPYDIHHKGQNPNRGRKDFIYEDSGFSINLGPDDLDDLGTQIEAAMRFLELHHGTITKLTGLTELRFDFGYSQRRNAEGYTVLAQCDYFPPDFLRKCGELGIGIELSLYPRSEEKYQNEN